MFEHSQTYELRRLLLDSQRVLCYTGAGVSTLSGLPDFKTLARGCTGAVNPFCLEGFESEAGVKLFYSLCSDLIFPSVKWQPNAVHRQIARLEKICSEVSVVTLNLDILHEDAGSSNVIHPHGTMESFRCTKCSANYEKDDVSKRRSRQQPVPHCDCGGVLRPNLVFFHENLEDGVIESVKSDVCGVDLVLILGTSCDVAPSNGIVSSALGLGARCVIANRDKTLYDGRETLRYYDLDEFAFELDAAISSIVE